MRCGSCLWGVLAGLCAGVYISCIYLLFASIYLLFAVYIYIIVIYIGFNMGSELPIPPVATFT